MRLSLERGVRGLNLGLVKLGTVLPTARHCCYISSKGAVLPKHNVRKWALPTRYMLLRITASIIKEVSKGRLSLYQTLVRETRAKKAQT